MVEVIICLSKLNRCNNWICVETGFVFFLSQYGIYFHFSFLFWMCNVSFPVFLYTNINIDFFLLKQCFGQSNFLKAYNSYTKIRDPFFSVRTNQKMVINIFIRLTHLQEREVNHPKNGLNDNYWSYFKDHRKSVFALKSQRENLCRSEAIDI